MSTDTSFKNVVAELSSEEYVENIRSDGAYDGGREVPPTKQVELTPVEQGVVRRCIDVLRAERIAAEKRFAEKKRDSFSADERVDIRSDRVLKEMDNEFQHLKDSEAPHLKGLVLERNQREAELRTFQARNKLSHLPSYPESHFWIVAILTVVLVVESILNANMLAKTNLYGIVGGWAEAIFISLANISFGFFAGLIPGRFIWYRKNPSVQKFAKGLLGFCIVFAIIFNFVFAHYRLTGSPELSDIMGKTLESMFNSPFAIFLDIKSFALFIVGLTFSGLAGWKGFSWDDRYPMYGAIYRSCVKARKAVLDAQDAIRDKAMSNIRRVQDGLESKVAQVGRSAGRVDSLEDICRQEMSRYEGVVKSLTSAMHHLISVYRDTNVDVRTSPAPVYFSIMPELPVSDTRLECDMERLQLDIEDNGYHAKELNEEINRTIDLIVDRQPLYMSSLNEFFKELEETTDDGLMGEEWDEQGFDEAA